MQCSSCASAAEPHNPLASHPQILGMLASQTEDFAAQANALADDIVAQGKLAAAVPSPNPNPSPFPDPSPP